MATETMIAGIYQLQTQLDQAKDSLKGVDENIRRLIGRDPSELAVQRQGQGLKRPPLNEDRTRGGRGLLGNNRRVYNHENDEPPIKKRGSVFNRLAGRVPDRPSHYDEEFEGKRQMISKIIVTPKEVPSRQEALDAQSMDEKSKARNRRMFGALLGTLQKFQQEETKLKSKEDKRAQVEKKIEEIEIREKAEIKKERKELFFNRKKKQAEIKMLELKMSRMQDHNRWEELLKPQTNFILTKAKPHIYYLPRKMNDATKAALAESKAELEKIIETRREDVNEELLQIEERMKRNFEPKKNDEEIHDDDHDMDDDDESHEVVAESAIEVVNKDGESEDVDVDLKPEVKSEVQRLNRIICCL
ncbi:PREDICTED: pinin isoform X2 [Nicrophorus vespilloides]|uniref:Pinin n=1 Tax=Nicrophorus vespilloides TaxID=110193 RepID=A0ABM1MW84_NICVS|nr:PREDICTED: pinin isoform X2 [Nicrophorus vespilloides]